jgi:hypothetical protein
MAHLRIIGRRHWWGLISGGGGVRMLRQGNGLGFIVTREGELSGVRSGRGLSKMVVEKWAWGGFFGGRFV